MVKKLTRWCILSAEMIMKDGFQIAIDGPVAAGKSTVARRVAETLGFLYIDTGAMYRTVTLMALRAGIDTQDEKALVVMVGETEIEVRLPRENEDDGRQSTVMCNGEDVSWEIRKGMVNREVAKVAALPKVREALVPVQQQIAEGKNVVMEGRDITYVVLPEADLKIFLDASMEKRVERFYKRRSTQKKGLTMEQVAEWLRERDETDTSRLASPLKLVPGVWHLDTSDLSLDEVVRKIVRRVREIGVDSRLIGRLGG